MNLDWLLSHVTHLDWLLSPVTQCLLIGLGLIGSLILWVSFMKELRSVRVNALQSRESIDLTVKDLSESVEQMRETLHNRDCITPTAPLAPGINSMNRAQALLMHLRREPVDSIAAVLGVPKNEIVFLLKLNRLLHFEKS
jgi:hypothetical protein